MRAEIKESEPNTPKHFDKNPLSMTTKPESKTYQNSHCGVLINESGPSESENKMNGDLSNIVTKVAKQANSRSQVPPSNQPGPSQQDNHERGASCGFYYGIKSYLHHFYGPPDKEVLKSGEYVQGDDLRFVVEPQRRGCWVRVGLWVGINLVLLGGVASLVGYLTPPRQAVVGQYQDFTVLDSWAVNFNYHLMLCQLVGLITLSFGAVVVVCSLLVANCHSAPPPPPAYLVMGAYLPTPTPTQGKHPNNSPTWGIHCIPLSGTLKSVQPQFIQSLY